MLTSITPYSRSLDNNFVMKSISHAADAERIAVFNAKIFGLEVSEMTRSLITHHPTSRPEYWLFVEDEATGEIVSALALLEWSWRYEDVTLKAGEMAIVGTLEAYRNRGLVRALAVRHQELLREGDFDLSHIQGIPYFYRQFGYEYAIPLEASWQLELRNVPEAPPEKVAQYSFRPATVENIPDLMRLYDETSAPLQISALRNEANWRYMLEHTVGTAIEGETWLVLDTAEHPIGYWRISQHGFGEGLIISETSRLNMETAEVLVGWLKTMAVERQKPYLRLNLPVSNDFLQAARCWGAYDAGTYAWQMKLVDVGRLLRKLVPVLERRIADSIFAGLSQKICLNLYREAFELDFQQGKMLAINAIGFSESWVIRIPPPQFIPLVLGYHSREELTKMHLDVSVGGQYRHLVDVLFPKMESFIFSNY